jgi:hypothetical protein
VIELFLPVRFEFARHEGADACIVHPL